MSLPVVISHKSGLFNKFNQFRSVYSRIGALVQPAFFSSLIHRSLEPNKLTLIPPSLLVNESRGLKIRGHLQLRCKDCYFARKDGVMHVMCSSYPRHKQRALTKREKYTWILTYAFQSKKRPY